MDASGGSVGVGGGRGRVMDDREWVFCAGGGSAWGGRGEVQTERGGWGKL